MNITKNIFRLKNSHLAMRNCFLPITLCLFALQTSAQKDTSKHQTIDINSSYRPVLRNAVKINLSASPFIGDTSRPKLAYNIPAQNLFFSYEPISLKPLALTQDTGLQLGVRNYLKVGFGNFTTPYVNGGFSFGDGKTSLVNVYANYISSRGKIANQDFNEINIKGLGSYFTKNNEAYGGVGYSQHQYYQYGYDHSRFAFDKGVISRSYQDIALTAGFRNTAVNNFNVNYNPNVEAHIFSRGNFLNESGIRIEAPAEKKFGESVSFKVAGIADLDNYKSKGATTNNFQITNNLFQVAPELIYYSDMFTFHGGVTPSWDNNSLSVLPNIYGEAQLQHNVLMIQAGWVGRYIKNSYRTISNENPYIQDPNFLLNTKETQYYGGIKATLGKHFSFNAKAAFITYNNIPLYINDNVDGKSFIVVNESKMDDIHIHGDLNYVSQDKFTLTGALDLNTYTGLKDQLNAWGLIPVKVTGSLRWNAFKEILFKADVFAFSGVPSLQGNTEKKSKPGTDLSAGAEFKITDKFSAWLDLNNILNSKYERWNHYPVYGLNVIGGLIFHF